MIQMYSQICSITEDNNPTKGPIRKHKIILVEKKTQCSTKVSIMPSLCSNWRTEQDEVKDKEKQNKNKKNLVFVVFMSFTMTETEKLETKLTFIYLFIWHIEQTRKMEKDQSLSCAHGRTAQRERKKINIR